MLKYVLKSIVFGFLFASSLEVMAQTEVLIRLKDDANVRKYVVAEKGKISFTNDLLFVDQMASSALVSFDLNAIQSVKFLPATAGVDMVFSDGEGACERLFIGRLLGLAPVLCAWDRHSRFRSSERIVYSNCG